MNIKPYVRNAKKHPDAQLKLIAASLKEYGWRQPIVVDRDNIIIVGHGRYAAYEAYPDGIKEPWIVKADDLTPNQVKGYRLMDNKSNESAWDMELVIEELKELDNDGFDIALTGFDADLLIEPDAKDDVVPENAPTRAKLGDVWALGPHRVLCGDSTEIGNLSSLLGKEAPDMVFTDPPYGVDYVSRVDKTRRKAWGGIKNDDLKGEGLVAFLRDSVGDLSKPKYVCCNWQSVKDFFEALGMPNSLIVWDKKSVGLGANYRSQHEFILFYGKLNHHRETNVWSLKRDSVSEYAHPTQKPVELIVRALINSSKEGSVIYDAFLGSGSTLIACEKTGRTCYGMELDPKYMDVIIKRWEDYTGEAAQKL